MYISEGHTLRCPTITRKSRWDNLPAFIYSAPLSNLQSSHALLGDSASALPPSQEQGHVPLLLFALDPASALSHSSQTFLFKLHSIFSFKRWTEGERDWSISYFKSGMSRTVFCCWTRFFFSVSKIEQKWEFEDLCIWSALLIWQTTFAGEVCFCFVLFCIPSYWEDKRLGSRCRVLWLILLYARLADLPETGTLQVNQANEAAQRGDVHYFVSHNDFKVNTHTVPSIL